MTARRPGGRFFCALIPGRDRAALAGRLITQSGILAGWPPTDYTVRAAALAGGLADRDPDPDPLPTGTKNPSAAVRLRLGHSAA